MSYTAAVAESGASAEASKVEMLSVPCNRIMRVDQHLHFHKSIYPNGEHRHETEVSIPVSANLRFKVGEDAKEMDGAQAVTLMKKEGYDPSRAMMCSVTTDNLHAVKVPYALEVQVGHERNGALANAEHGNVSTFVVNAHEQGSATRQWFDMKTAEEQAKRFQKYGGCTVEKLLEDVNPDRKSIPDKTRGYVYKYAGNKIGLDYRHEIMYVLMNDAVKQMAGYPDAEGRPTQPADSTLYDKLQSGYDKEERIFRIDKDLFLNTVKELKECVLDDFRTDDLKALNLKIRRPISNNARLVQKVSDQKEFAKEKGQDCITAGAPAFGDFDAEGLSDPEGLVAMNRDNKNISYLVSGSMTLQMILQAEGTRQIPATDVDTFEKMRDFLVTLY